MDLFALSLMSWLLYMIIRTLEALYLLKEHDYNRKCRYFIHLIKEPQKAFSLLDSLPLLCIPLFILFRHSISILLFFVLYFTLFIISHRRIYKEKKAKLFTIPAQSKRVLLMVFVLYLLPFLSIFYCYEYGSCCHYNLYLIILGYFQYFIVMLASKLMYPIEFLINKAKKKRK